MQDKPATDEQIRHWRGHRNDRYGCFHKMDARVQVEIAERDALRERVRKQEKDIELLMGSNAISQGFVDKLRMVLLNVFCDPAGNPSFSGSDGDRKAVRDALDFTSQPNAALERRDRETWTKGYNAALKDAVTEMEAGAYGAGPALAIKALKRTEPTEDSDA